MTVLLSLLFVLGVLSFLFILVTNLKYRSLPLPPGPRGWPILGNFFEMPATFEWLHWGKFKGLYGEYIIRHSIVTIKTCTGNRACELRDCARQAGYLTELAKELRRYLREEIICIFRST
jgi:hypothetical protein